MLQKYVSLKLAGMVMLVALIAIFIALLIILFGPLPLDLYWESGLAKGQVLAMTIGMEILVGLMILMVGVRVDYINVPKLKAYAKTAMWVIFITLVLKTIGNLTSIADKEIAMFTAITAILALFAYRLAMREV